MSEGDRQKRERGEKDKKLKLASPNFIISPTRLSIRNVPYSWDEKRLKDMAVNAVKRRATKAVPRVKQVKILYEEQKKEADGKPRSKGLAFIEFDSHEHAMCALRELNNNPDVFVRDRRPIVEFAVDNVKVLKMRDAKEAKKGGKKAQWKEGSAEDRVSGAERKKAKYEAWKEKKRAFRAEKLANEKARKRARSEAGGEGGEGGSPAKRPRADGAGGEARGETKRGKRGGERAARKEKAHAGPKDWKEFNEDAPAPAPAPDRGAKAGRAAKGAKGAKGGDGVGAGARPEARKRAPDAKGRARAEQARGEERHRKKQRAGEDRMDKLAALGDGEGGVQKKRRRGEATDGVDALAASYTQRLFGSGGGGKGGAKKAAGGDAESFKRWFD